MIYKNETSNQNNSDLNFQRHRMDKERKRKSSISNSENVKMYAKRFSQGHWTSFHPLALVEVGMSYKTILDVADGFGAYTPACREYFCAVRNWTV